ncbi:PPOX class F420-dependent oxidoreductase [Actinomadura rubrisoli]|uniref:PPOX class F420-dependent oxidoreductase n=1 Tax=Actinomadura rubrisoli TaxID=2530368 RepID=A0A4R5BJ48_9ACTN|nr:PPOX class F420-dependent oxidoreductase [Actinomadura rubrisoli]TDD85146.1 PPOX class F420-dependent oxidoreductase [Actinomadura rubrisoli]
MNVTPILETLKVQPTVLLTTYRRDGTPVGTPVHVVVRGDHAYFRTFDKAVKNKRLARNPEVEIAPSTFKGEPTGSAVHGRARLLTGEEAKPIRRLLARKYPFLQGVVVPLAHRLKRYRTLHYELTLAGTEPDPARRPSDRTS